MRDALGFFEVRSLVAAIEAADAMMKAADVALQNFNYVGSGIMCVIVSGEVAAVKAAIEAAQNRAGLMADVIGVNVIPRPNKELFELFED